MGLRKKIIAGLGLGSLVTALYFANTTKHETGTRLVYGVGGSALTAVCLYQLLRKESNTNQNNNSAVAPRENPRESTIQDNRAYVDQSDRRQVNVDKSDRRQVKIQNIHFH